MRSSVRDGSFGSIVSTHSGRVARIASTVNRGEDSLRAARRHIGKAAAMNHRADNSYRTFSTMHEALSRSKPERKAGGPELDGKVQLSALFLLP